MFLINKTKSYIFVFFYGYSFLDEILNCISIYDKIWFIYRLNMQHILTYLKLHINLFHKGIMPILKDIIYYYNFVKITSIYI